MSDDILIPMAIAMAYTGFQVLALVLLIRRLRRPELAWGGAERRCYAWTLALMPTVMLLLFTAACGSEWRGGKGMGWFGVINQGWAGLAILPVWLVSAVSLVWALASPAYLMRSKPNALMMLTMALICLWYAGMPLWPETNAVVAIRKGLQHGLSEDLLYNEITGLYLLAVPLAPCVNLSLLLIHIRRGGQLTGRVWPFALAWAGALAVTVWVKVLAAMARYEAFRYKAPSDCFVVSAAARGHRRFVGSAIDPAGGVPVNRQLARLRAFEGRLRARWPRVHRPLRRLYNIVGPAVARRLRSPWAADIVYVLLKPVEWAAELYRPHCPNRDIDGLQPPVGKGNQR
ncbi:MAG TPA: DUF6688 family protein [Phycisphaerae bacterium]|nr:DUF6688 family protein [Phycisphaerae bacterium]